MYTSRHVTLGIRRGHSQESNQQREWRGGESSPAARPAPSASIPPIIVAHGYAFGNVGPGLFDTGTNPTGGSLVWHGVMLGVDIRDDTAGRAIRGDAEITIDGFVNPTVDVEFSNIINDAGVERGDIAWRDMPVQSGSFASSTSASRPPRRVRAVSGPGFRSRVRVRLRRRRLRRPGGEAGRCLTTARSSVVRADYLAEYSASSSRTLTLARCRRPTIRATASLRSS